MTCYQLTVTGGSGTVVPKGVTFPEAYSKTGPGLGFSIHAPLSSYPMPGPELISGGTEATPQLLTFGKITGAPAAPPAATGAASAPPAATTPAATATAAPVSSSPASSAPAPAVTSAPADAQPTPTPAHAASQQPSATVPVAQPTAGTGSGSGSTLGDNFTIDEFVAWLLDVNGQGAQNKRRHARAFRA